MFRSIKKTKGIAVDIDSFGSLIIDDWIEINQVVDCVFLTTKKVYVDELSRHFNPARIILLEMFEYLFSPNQSTHNKVLNALGINSYELAYLSCNYSFLEKSRSFLTGSIWITENVTYQQASKSPDIIIDNISQLKNDLSVGLSGFYGEMEVIPHTDFSSAFFQPVIFDVDGVEVPFFM